ncbi:glycoside hydrolase superfamily [Xylariaceae sp. FL0594]|nr:glycoside hydrolase superfamily [Xylariaceae sp. FL0594]
MANMGPPRYSLDSDPGEHAPLDNAHPHGNLPPADRSLHDFDHPSYRTPYRDNHSPFRDHPSTYASGPGAHPDSAFSQLRQNRGREAQQNSITPGADNFSEAAAGGIPGLAMSVAERHARESGLEAIRNQQPYQQQPSYSSAYLPQAYHPAAPQRPSYEDAQSYGGDYGYDASRPYYANSQMPYEHSYSHGSSSNGTPVPSGPTPTRSLNSFHSDPFRDPHVAYGQRMDPRLGQVNPNDIDDDGDDGLEYRRSARNSMLSLGNSTGRGAGGAAPAAGVAGAAGTAGAAAASGGVLGGLMGKNRNGGVAYDPVRNPAAGIDSVPRAEKSEWIAKQSSSKKKWRWIIGVLAVVIIAGAVVGGVLGSMFSKKSSDSSNGGGGGSGSGSGGSTSGQAAGGGALWQTAQQDMQENGDLDINSDEIKSLLNNPNLHKVFPGVDYTPLNVQYPDCLKHPPSQNNVTRDVAILSQLTNTIRLYGTDCNQTEMTIHALRQLKLEDDIKIWLGVWQDNNQTTNKRQLDQMWTVLDQYGDKPFKGLIIGNEILFRKEMTAQTLGNLLDSVRTNLSRHSWDLPVATSDLGDNWDSSLAEISDYIMGNVHPFFAGQDAKEAASWTYTFWNNKAGAFFKSDPEKNVISEIGWPSQGGTDCGAADTCEKGAVAGIDELNTLMSTWVCQALQNGTNYFWFEMFDEPWKYAFDEEGKEWEDHWGILDVNRRLKDGVKIPDCGGKTV